METTANDFPIPDSPAAKPAVGTIESDALSNGGIRKFAHKAFVAFSYVSSILLGGYVARDSILQTGYSNVNKGAFNDLKNARDAAINAAIDGRVDVGSKIKQARIDYQKGVSDMFQSFGLTPIRGSWATMITSQKVDTIIKAGTMFGIVFGVLYAVSNSKSLRKFLLGEEKEERTPSSPDC
jgi:hypothetical protein